MTQQLSLYKKATSLIEVDNAVRFDIPVPPDHSFFTDFSDVRGEFEAKMLYSTLNVNPKTFIYNRQANLNNKTVLFLAGMWGSGKTSELARIAKNLHNPECFYCIICNLDEGLDVNDIEYMDILIYQLERLFEELDNQKIKVDQGILASMQKWFEERVEEVNKVIKKEGGFEVEIKAETPSLLSFIGIAAKLRANLQGSKENAEKIRTSFRNNFSDFAKKFNEFIEHVNMKLRGKALAQELLFIVDGLEKIGSKDIRRKIVVDDNKRILDIKVNTIFTLPPDLFSFRPELRLRNNVLAFPFIKIRDRNGAIVPKAMERFEEFVYKRIAPNLFDSPETVQKAILHSGGSPRELLRILEYANIYADEDHGEIRLEDLDKAIQKLASESAQYLTVGDFEKLKELKALNDQGKVQANDNDGKFLDLISKLVVMEYNSGSYKRVNPIVEASELYKQYVG